jgi:hypothetical protein
MQKAAEGADKRTYEYQPYPVHGDVLSTAAGAKTRQERSGGGRRAPGPQIGRFCTYLR